MLPSFLRPSFSMWLVLHDSARCRAATQSRKDVARLRKMGNASTRNAYSSSQEKVSSHSHGISKIEGLIVSTTPEPK